MNANPLSILEENPEFLSNDKLSKFISNLLSEPQIKCKRIVCSFCLEINDIYALHEFIQQYVINRDKSKFISIKIAATFTNGDSITFNSIDQLNTISTRINDSASICRSLDIKWVFLTKFDSSGEEPVPLRQVVSISFNTPDLPDSILEDFGEEVFDFIYRRTGSIEIEIKHNNLTWANPLLSVLSEKLENYVYHKDSELTKIIRKNKKYIKYLIIGVSLTFYLILVYLSYSTLKNSLTNLNKNIDSLILISTNGYWTMFLLLTMLFSGIFYFLVRLTCKMIASNLLSNKPSWLLLSKGSENAKLKFEKQEKDNVVIKLLGIVFSIVINLIASYLYSFFTSIKL